jgi:small subunit ribosomal protein S21
MIKIDVRNYKSLDHALKVYKQKHNKSKLIEELQERKEYTKPSVQERSIKLKARYIQKIKDKSK